MKIVHVQHPFIPGRGYQENYLPKMQSELGHEVYIITTDVTPNKFTEQAQSFSPGKYVYDGVTTYRCKTITYDTEAATFPLGVRKIISRINPDVIHSHRLVSLLSISTIYASIRSDANLFFDLHIDNDNFHLDEAYKRIGFSMFKNLILPILKKKSNGFIGVNPFACQFLEDRLGVQNPDFSPLGVDTDKFYQSDEERNQTREELGVSDQFLIITAGNLTRNKKIKEIIQAVSVLSDPPVELLILGQGPDEYMQELRSLTSEKNLEENVTFKSFVDHSSLSKYYNAADIGVWPGKLGITIIEAIGCGLPIIVEDSVATNFLVENENGFSITEPTPDKLSDYFLQYLHDPLLRDRHQKNALELTRDTLSWRAIAERSLAIYKSNGDKTISNLDCYP